MQKLLCNFLGSLPILRHVLGAPLNIPAFAREKNEEPSAMSRCDVVCCITFLGCCGASGRAVARCRSPGLASRNNCPYLGHDADGVRSMGKEGEDHHAEQASRDGNT